MPCVSSDDDLGLVMLANIDKGALFVIWKWVIVIHAAIVNNQFLLCIHGCSEMVDGARLAGPTCCFRFESHLNNHVTIVLHKNLILDLKKTNDSPASPSNCVKQEQVDD